MSDVITRVIERFWTIGIIDPPKSGEVTLAWSDLLAPSEKEKLANMATMADVAQKTQQAYGTPAVDEMKWSTKTGHRVRVFPVSVF